MLTLKRIQILGFKSFADKAELVFEGAGITAIVGPNGCGKSNISDAVAWVLGEQSAKSLRGGRMEDVIFNGTRSRLPLGLAEVTLTLLDPEILREANSMMQSAPAESSGGEGTGQSDSFEVQEEGYETVEKDPDPAAAAAVVSQGPAAALATKRKRRPRFQPKPGELVVARRLFRSGESEYLLNGRQVRLRDIQDIFLGTGLGPDSYAIIEQGRVGLILSSKPSDRRSIIEEAAGITKFKSKRKLAESKLEQARQNLLRVNDITEEVSKQLGSLKRQAAKTRRYRELRERMRELSKSLFNARSDRLNALLDQSLFQLQEVSGLYQQKHQQIEIQESRYRENNSGIFNLEGQLKQLRDQLSQLNLEVERGQQRVHFQKEQLRELEARSIENSREIERLASQEIQYQSETDQKQQILHTTLEQFERIQQDFLSQDSNYQSIQAQAQELESSSDRHRSQLLESVSQAATLRNQLLQLDELEVRLDHQIRLLILEREDSSSTQQRLARERETGLQKQREEEQIFEQLQKQLASISASLATDKEKAEQTRQSLAERKDQFSSATHRLKSLEELAAHHAYTTEAVRLLLASASESSPDEFHTPGILADLIEVESPHEAMVEEFLRQELEFLLVESAPGARQGISLLRQKGSGRSTFLLWGSHRPASPEEVDALAEDVLRTNPSLVSLKSIIKIPQPFENAVREALPQVSRAFIASNYDHALELAEKYPSLIFLAPEGEMVRGRLISGGGKASGGHLSLKKEIRDLPRKARMLEKTILAQEGELQVLQGSIGRAEAELAGFRQSAQELEKNLFASEFRLQQIQNELEKASQRQNLANLEYQRTHGEKAQLQSRRAQYQEDIEVADKRKAEIEHLIASQQESLKQLKDRSAEEAQNLSELRSELATFRERKQSAEADLARLAASLKECQERKEKLDFQRSSWAVQSGQIQASIQGLEEQLFDQAVQKASLEAEIRSRENELGDLRSAQMNLEQELQSRRTEIEEVQNQKVRLEIERARLGSDLSHLEETCLQELGMRLQEIRPETPQTLDENAFTELNQEYQDLKTRIDAMGPVNMMALEEYQECEQRYQFLTAQRQDLLDSIEDTNAAIKEIDQVSREQFKEAFIAINANFQESFKSLFGGGHGEMKLLDELDELDSGIEIIAQPPGKRLQNVLLLSGGEKALTAIALLLAIFKFQPSPFCVLDEVDAPLDEVNTGRYAQMIKTLSHGTQFLLITHSKRTMEVADTLYGVTMQEAGVSKIVSVQFE